MSIATFSAQETTLQAGPSVYRCNSDGMGPRSNNNGVGRAAKANTSCSSRARVQQPCTCRAADAGNKPAFQIFRVYNPTTCRELSGMVQVAGLVDLACSINHY